MTILTLANSKAGGGKTTIADCLAAELSKRGNTVVLLDADPQRSLTKLKISETGKKVAPLETKFMPRLNVRGQ